MTSDPDGVMPLTPEQVKGVRRWMYDSTSTDADYPLTPERRSGPSTQLERRLLATLDGARALSVPATGPEGLDAAYRSWRAGHYLVPPDFETDDCRSELPDDHWRHRMFAEGWHAALRGSH